MTNEQIIADFLATYDGTRRTAEECLEDARQLASLTDPTGIAAYWCGRYEQCQRFLIFDDLDELQREFVDSQADMAIQFARRLGIEITPATEERDCDMTPRESLNIHDGDSPDDDPARDVAWANSVRCTRCGRPTGLAPEVLKANSATSCYCASCTRETAPVDP